MFRKPFKVKTNSQIKGSERKKLRACLEQQISHLKSEDISSLLPSSNMTQAKLLCHSGALSIVYYCEQNPYFFVIDNVYFPTVYTLWRYPNILPTMATWANVFEKLSGGADLMLPGVVAKLCSNLENLKKGDVCAIRLAGNGAPIAVGISSVNGIDVYSEDRKGKAVIIMHVFKDALWESGNKSYPPELPDLLFHNEDLLDSIEKENCDDLATAEEKIKEEITQEELSKLSLCINEEQAECVEQEVNATDSSSEQPSHQTDNELKEMSKCEMDDLLMNCFMTALKFYGKKLELPLLTSTFYRSYILSCCLPDQKLDIKKTTHKKLSIFLDIVQKMGLIKVEELSKGVESVTFIDNDNDILKSFIPNSSVIRQLKDQLKNNSSASATKEYEFPKIRELSTVSASVLNLFKFTGASKGSAFTSNEVRKVLKDYVKENSLETTQDHKQVVLDPILTSCLVNRNEYIESLTWEQMHNRCLSKMQPAYEITFNDEVPIFKKGRLEHINISLEQRSGNKKVTIIQNLEIYGIDPSKLAHEIQLGVATSTSVSPASNGKGNQVLIQGNQIKFIGKLFLEKYKIPRKHIAGLELASTKKGSK